MIYKIVIFLSFFITFLDASKDIYKVVPIVSSNPTAGTGAGILGTYMYHFDKSSSPSQAIASLQYTNTDSYNIFLVNKLFFNQDKWQSNTLYAHIFNNSEFSVDLSDNPISIIPDVINPNFEVTIDAILEQLLYMFRDDIYFGGQVFYLDQRIDARNEEGEFFMRSNGIESLKRGGYGLTFSYDTRTKDEKFYPRDSYWINLSFNNFPKFMGSNTEFYNFMLNARKYIPFGKKDDVLALQFYGQYSSEDTPDGALPAMGAKNIIRGFPIGKYKARFLNSAQVEYRWRLKDTSFRFVPFFGYANLSGGSKGTGENQNRDSNNGDYYSQGLGFHYILSKDYQLDYRLDVVYSSDDEVSVYATINQAF